jgi:hypothetical protein
MSWQLIEANYDARLAPQQPSMLTQRQLKEEPRQLARARGLALRVNRLVPAAHGGVTPRSEGEEIDAKGGVL